MANYLNIPQSPFVDLKTGYLAPEWLQWITSPSFLTITVGNALGVTSGGTGLSSTPAINQFLIGNGTGYSLSSTIPAAALPAFTGDATSTAGTSALTLATVNGNVGSWGTATAVASFTVNAKGLITAASNTNITGAAGSFTVVTGFGCNGKAAQAAVASGASIVTTGSTNAAPFGYTTAAQADRIVTLVNAMQAALIANGILS
jgi:hypothetical protein